MLFCDSQSTTDEANAIHFFLFINPRSGDQQGAQILNLNLGLICFKSLPNVRVHVYSLVDDTECGNGLASAKTAMAHKEKLKLNPQIHICCAGGDGSLTSLLSKIEERGMDVNNIMFSLLPFGTGNDLARFLGTWSLDKQAAKDVMRSGHLRQLVYKQIRGQPVKLDVWDVHVTTLEGGSIRQVIEKSRENEQEVSSEIFQKLLNNGAIGAQCYVGSDAERLRTNNRVANITSYTIQTIKWGLFKSFSSVTSMLDRIEQFGNVVAYVRQDKYRKRRFSISTARSLSSVGDKSSTPNHQSNGQENSKPHPVIIDSNAIELVFQNIPSIWGRMLNLWNRAESGSAIDLNNVDNPGIAYGVDPSTWHQQESSDGEFELFVLEDKISYVKKELAINRTNLARIGHFKQARIVFQRLDEEQTIPLIPKHIRSSFSHSNASQPFRESKRDSVRIMIDGEFFIVHKPKYIDITFWKQINIMGPPNEDISSDEEFSSEEAEPAKPRP
ncbi:ATP-NAD kinase-like domain-containing protein [Umbelopsis sp. PMI_123]|nr:ATP-NAD kinase-like domain-containing protein [Umbelopsis sp. PMI_123]